MRSAEKIRSGTALDSHVRRSVTMSVIYLLLGGVCLFYRSFSQSFGSTVGMSL